MLDLEPELNCPLIFVFGIGGILLFVCGLVGSPGPWEMPAYLLFGTFLFGTSIFFIAKTMKVNFQT
jgi:hypothetical protein